MSTEPEKFELWKMGIVHSPFKGIEDCPMCGKDMMAEGTVEVFPEYRDCMKCLREGMFIHLITWFDRSSRDVMKTHPRRDMTVPERGVFATRCPSRPNPIACTVVEITKIEENQIHVKGLDVFDGTPLIDIKPQKVICHNKKKE